MELVNHCAELMTIAEVERLAKVKFVPQVVDLTQDVQTIWLVLISVVLTLVKIQLPVVLMLRVQ